MPQLQYIDMVVDVPDAAMLSSSYLLVVNRAQRWEQHKLAVFLVGGGSEVLCADLMLVAILVKCEFARNFQRVVIMMPTPVEYSRS